MRRLGLATRGELRLVEDKLQTIRQRLATSSERLAQLAAAAEQLQEERRENARRYKARIAQLESEQAQRVSRVSDAAHRASQRIAELEEALRTRDAELVAAIRQETVLEQRVASAMRELQVARESLAAIEVKLDILEGAANVLDHRTRADFSAGNDGPR
jgi:chromosome segregation ATPase